MDENKHGGGFKSGKTKKQIQLVVITARDVNLKILNWEFDALTNLATQRMNNCITCTVYVYPASRGSTPAHTAKM